MRCFSFVLAVGLLSALKGRTEGFKFTTAKSSLDMGFVTYLNLQLSWCLVSNSICFQSLTLGGMLQLDHAGDEQIKKKKKVLDYFWALFVEGFLCFCAGALKLLIYCYMGSLPRIK